MSSFAELGLSQPLLQALRDLDFRIPTPIQAQAIPALLAGRDLLGVAQTGTGKTAAFGLPLLQVVAGGAGPGPRLLVLSPTRELAAQLCEHLTRCAEHLPLRVYALYGGVELGPQITALRQGVQVVVATPGRLLQLLALGHVSLDGVQALVLDEADRLLDLGFREELDRVLAVLPAARQSALLSATMPPAVQRLADALLRDPVRAQLASDAVPLDRIEQRVMFLRSSDKQALLAHLLGELAPQRTIVFMRTREGVQKMSAWLMARGLSVAALHGQLTQAARAQALEGFRDGAVPILVATDLASRGIDVVGVSHVFNVELPRQVEDYVHRVGRTGRAGQQGVAISFCDETEGGTLRDLERALGAPLAPDLSVPFTWHEAIPGSRASGKRKGGRRRGKRRRR